MAIRPFGLPKAEILGSLSLCAVLCVSSATLGAQPLPVTALKNPRVEIPEPFSQIGSVRELRDGRVLVVDTRDYVIKVVDFATRQAALIGRKGAGPGEYRSPLSVFEAPGDSSVVFDGGLTRLLMILPNGTPGPSVSTAGLGTSGGGMVTRFVPGSGDARGRLYATGVPVTMTPQGPQHADSFPIIRWDRKANHSEVVAYLRSRSMKDRGGDIDPLRAVLTPIIPFVVGDQWAVSRDGRVALLRYDDYRVDYVLPDGRLRQGQPNHFERIRVTDGHKAEWREDQVRQNGVSASDVKDPPRWPEFLPPFPGRPALFAPDGRLWVRRTVPAGEATMYDLVDTLGRVNGRVTLPARSHVVGFGRGSLYVVRRDADDLEYLGRYPLR